MDKNKKILAKIARASNRRTQDGFKYLNLLVGFLLLGAILIGGNLQRPVSASYVEDLNTTIQWGKYRQPITVYVEQVEAMKKEGYSNTRILDLLTIRTMECNQGYKGDCFYRNGRPSSDVGSFQINHIHVEQYNRSWQLRGDQDWGGLFTYQMRYANDLVQSYMDRFCDWKWSKNNETRFKCVAVSYNGHPIYKENYKKLGWEKRKIISDYLFENGILTY